MIIEKLIYGLIKQEIVLVVLLHLYRLKLAIWANYRDWSSFLVWSLLVLDMIVSLKVAMFIEKFRTVIILIIFLQPTETVVVVNDDVRRAKKAATSSLVPIGHRRDAAESTVAISTSHRAERGIFKQRSTAIFLVCCSTQGAEWARFATVT